MKTIEQFRCLFCIDEFSLYIDIENIVAILNFQKSQHIAVYFKLQIIILSD